MNDNSNPIILASPAIPVEVDAVIERYEPVLFNEAQRTTGMQRMREIARACDPKTANEARVLLATASRYLADVAPETELDPDRWLVDDAVAAWAHAQIRFGASTSTLSNRLALLRRMIRVLAGLPAHMPRGASSRVRCSPLAVEDRRQLEHAMTANPGPAAAYIAAVGANLVGARAVGWTVSLDSERRAWMVNDDVRRPIVEPLETLAGLHDGVVVAAHGWDQLRKLARWNEVEFNKSVSLVSFASLALAEQRPVAELLARYRLSRRAIEDSQATVHEIDPVAARLLLRGD